MANIQEDMNAFIQIIQECAARNCPEWLTPNSNFVGVKPGHNLDLLEVSFDYIIQRTAILSGEVLSGETPDFLSDPSQLVLVPKDEVK